MNNLLIPALILLIVTNVSFALLALSWKHKATVSEHAAMGMVVEVMRAYRDGYASGEAAGLKQGIGQMYKAAIKAEHSHGDVLEALRTVRRREEESIVQVPQEV